MKLLIDGDIIIYRAGFAVQSKRNMRVEEDGEISYPPVSHALQAAKMMLNNILNKCEHTEYVVYLSSDDRSNFRYDIAKTKPYKGNRTKPKPIYYQAVRDYVTKMYHTEHVYGQEADDALGIACLHTTEEVLCLHSNAVIVTIDKDLDTIPGWHYNFVKDKKYYVSRTGAYRYFCKQLLIGDPVDNIVGIKGIGPVKAEQIMKTCKRDKAKMLQAAFDLYDNEELFLEIGRLLWIRREENETWLPDLESLRRNKSHVHLNRN